MVIYLSCKYYKTIYSAPLDVKASQDLSPQRCVQWDVWESSLCLTSVLVIKSWGHFSGQKRWFFIPTSVPSLWDSQQHQTPSWCAIDKHCPLEGPFSTALAVRMLVGIQHKDMVLISPLLVCSKDKLRVWRFISDCLENCKWLVSFTSTR